MTIEARERIPRIAVIIERLGPYHAARMRALASLVGFKNCVTIEICAESSEYAWDRVSDDRFQRCTLFADRPYQTLAGSEIARALYGALSESAPDAVAINGWFFPEARAAALWCRRNDRTAVLMSESQEGDSPRMALKEWIKRRRVAAMDAALVGGATQVDYLRKLGMESPRVFCGYDVVDNEHFARGSAAARLEAPRYRGELGLPERYFLASARFIEKKNLPRLLEAYGLYRKKIGPDAWDLVLLGDGPLRRDLLSVRERLSLEHCVHLPGFVQYGRLPAYYGLARAFILPSTHEQWGLVVNEAMAAGLPVLVSAAAGAAQLVSHGQNGWVFQPWKATQIAACMEVAHHSNLQAVSEAALRRIDPYTPARFAEALLDAVHAGDHHRRSRERRRESTVLWAVPAPGAYVRPRAPEKIAVLIERLGPYHVARMRAVGAVWGEDRCVAIEIAAHSKEYEWDQVAGDGFLRRTLVPDRVYQELTACEVMRATDRALSEERPDIVAVNGWRSPEARAAVLWCKRNSRPAILMSASQFQDAPRLWARELMKSWRLRAYDSALVGGTSQLNYAIKLGMDPERVVTGYNVVDNQHFADGAAAARGAEARLRVQLNLPKRYFMSVVRFLPRKGLETLLEAYALYRNDAGQGAWDLVILGDGELRPKLLAMSRLLGLELWVQWPGFKQYDELPAYYGLASAFVLPSSREQWGLVVNEAMAAGLPVVVSRRCGCAPDLVVHGRNGFTFDAGDAAALARALRDMTEADLESMRKESQRTISAWTPAAFAGNLARASSLARGYASSRRRRVFAPLFWF